MTGRGIKKLGTEEVLTQALLPDEHSDEPGLIYMYPELVADTK